MASLRYCTKKSTAGERLIISYISKKLNSIEQRWHINEKECYAIIWAVNKYRPYLDGQLFKLRTDNRALVWLHNAKEEKAKFLRWSLLLQEFSYSIEHVPGRLNELPDALSRHPSSEVEEDEVDSIERLFPPMRLSAITNPQPASPLISQVVKEAQVQDAELQAIAKALRELQEKANQPGTSTSASANEALLAKYRVTNEILYVIHEDKPRIMVPPQARDNVLHYYYDDLLAGHPGQEETLRAIKETFYWPTMKDDVNNFVRECDRCQRYKFGERRAKAALHRRTPSSPFRTLSIDLMGPYPRSSKGNTMLLTITELFSRWVEAFPLREATTNIIWNKLETEIFPRFGFPEEIISRSRTAVSKTVEEIRRQ